MPPKKKKGKGKGKAGKKGKRGKGKGKGKKKGKKEGQELTAKDLYTRSHKENARLREDLASHVAVARRAQDTSSSLQNQISAAKEDFRRTETDKRDIITDLTRQYKSIQMSLGVRMQELEGQVAQLQQELGRTKAQLEVVTKERDEYKASTEDLQEKLRNIVQTLEGSYETILLDAMDTMTSKLELLRTDWTKDAVQTDHRLIQLYSEFGGRYISGTPASRQTYGTPGNDDDDNDAMT